MYQLGEPDAEKLFFEELEKDAQVVLGSDELARELMEVHWPKIRDVTKKLERASRKPAKKGTATHGR